VYGKAICENDAALVATILAFTDIAIQAGILLTPTLRPTLVGAQILRELDTPNRR
jgi:hypothetical protein